jgi:hypothetical protein
MNVKNKNLRFPKAGPCRKFRSDRGEIRNLNAHLRYKPGSTKRYRSSFDLATTGQTSPEREKYDFSSTCIGFGVTGPLAAM